MSMMESMRDLIENMNFLAIDVYKKSACVGCLNASCFCFDISGAWIWTEFCPIRPFKDLDWKCCISFFFLIHPVRVRLCYTHNWQRERETRSCLNLAYTNKGPHANGSPLHCSYQLETIKTSNDIEWRENTRDGEKYTRKTWRITFSF